MPRIDELITFCKIVDQKSFSRAAEQVGISQPAVSLQVKAMEEDYGVQLLHRDGMDILPTEQGKIVYEFAQQIIRLYERSQQEVRSLSSVVIGRLDIGASTGPGENVVPLLLGRFKNQYPEVSIALRVADSQDIINGIFNHRLELGFVGTYRRDRYLAFEPFLHDQLIVVTYPEHPWVNRSSVSFQELIQTPLILQQQGSGATTVLQDALSEQGISWRDLNIVMELGLQESTKAAVAAGFGVTIISKLGAKDELERGSLVEIHVEDLELRRDIYVCYNRSLPLSNLATTFLEFAKQDKHSLFAGEHLE
jgi:DNA-binding transcriptional LysR family regulator